MALRVSICVLNWEQPTLTTNCLAALLALPEFSDTESLVDVILIDNGSRDDSVRQIQLFVDSVDYPHIHFLTPSKNKGYAAGNNIGIRYAFNKLAPDYIWILNNDTVPRKDSLKYLISAAIDKPQVAIWGSTLLEADGAIIQTAGGCYYSPCLSTYKQALKGVSFANSKQLTLKKPLDYIAGASMFIKAELLSQEKLLDEEYFLFFEELDLCKRVPESQSIEWCKESVIVHKGGASMPNKRNASVSGVAEYHSNISALKFTHTYYAHCLLIMVPFRFMAKFFKYLALRDLHLLKPLALSYWDFFTRRTS